MANSDPFSVIDGKTAQPEHRDQLFEWTVMVYLAGDNNLSDEMVWAVKELYRVGAPPGVAVTVQFDPKARGRSTHFFRLPSREGKVDNDGVCPILAGAELGETNSDASAIADFVVRSMHAAKARRYMLILSGHGGGILGDFLTDLTALRNAATSLTIPD